MIANPAPNTATHHGVPAGRFSARRTPVTTALKSPILMAFLNIFCIKASKPTAAITVTNINFNALKPKK